MNVLPFSCGTKLKVGGGWRSTRKTEGVRNVFKVS